MTHPKKQRGALRWRPKPASTVLTLVLLVSAAALVLFEIGALPYKVYVVHTGSMSPTMPSESAVVVREHRYHVGEAVAFIEHGTTITHRLVAIRANGTITTKGDANLTVDPWHPSASRIIGGVVAAPRGLGYLLTYVKTPEGWASIVVAMLCLWQMWAIAMELLPGRSAAPASPKRPALNR